VHADEKLTAFLELESTVRAAKSKIQKQLIAPLVSAGQHRWFTSAAKAIGKRGADTRPLSPCLAYKQKWPPKRTATLVLGNFLELLNV
jgi:hypothetical protein